MYLLVGHVPVRVLAETRLGDACGGAALPLVRHPTTRLTSLFFWWCSGWRGMGFLAVCLPAPAGRVHIKFFTEEPLRRRRRRDGTGWNTGILLPMDLADTGGWDMCLLEQSRSAGCLGMSGNVWE
jgi:hypothetical protein